VEQDERFEREGNHLIKIVPVAFTQLALGATITVESLDGEHKLQIPSGTQTNKILRVESAGLPSIRTGKRGDLVVVVRLVVPEKLSDEQRTLLTTYADTEHIPVQEENDNGSSFWDKLKDTLTGKSRHDEEQQ